MGADRARLGAADPYAAILELAEIEHSLLDDGRLDELNALAGRWDELTGDLPAKPPPGARDALERALELHTRIGGLLLARRAGLLAQLTALTHAGRTAEGYARSAASNLTRIDQSA